MSTTPLAFFWEREEKNEKDCVNQKNVPECFANPGHGAYNGNETLFQAKFLLKCRLWKGFKGQSPEDTNCPIDPPGADAVVY